MALTSAAKHELILRPPLPWAGLASIIAAVVQAGMLLQRIRASEARVKTLEAQVRSLELWQQRQRGRQDAQVPHALQSSQVHGQSPEP